MNTKCNINTDEVGLEYYCFEILLPYSIRVPTQENIEFVFGEHKCCLLHLGRVPTPNGQFEFPLTAYVPADKYGLYFKSRVVLVLTGDLVRKLWTSECEEIQNLFGKLDDYVSLSFSNSASGLKGFVFGSVNYFLNLYRVLSQDWHALPVMPKDVPHVTIKKQKDGTATFLTLIALGNQVMSMTGNDVLPENLMVLLKNGLSTGGKMNPLAILEADIHEKATQGGFIATCILIGLLAEEVIKEHVVQFVIIKNRLHPVEARKSLIKSNGKYRGIAELVDRANKENKACFIETLIGWRPYDTNQYADWDKNVRDLRNEVIHGGKKDISFEQVEQAWLSCFEFLALSANKFIEALSSGDEAVSSDETIRFYVPLTKRICPDGLFGDFNL